MTLPSAFPSPAQHTAPDCDLFENYVFQVMNKHTVSWETGQKNLCSQTADDSELVMPHTGKTYCSLLPAGFNQEPLYQQHFKVTYATI